MWYIISRKFWFFSKKVVFFEKYRYLVTRRKNKFFLQLWNSVILQKFLPEISICPKATKPQIWSILSINFCKNQRVLLQIPPPSRYPLLFHKKSDKGGVSGVIPSESEGGPRTRIRAEARTAEPRGPKFKIRGHSAPRSAARMPADVCRTLIKQTISDDSAVYFWLLNMSQNKMQKNSLKDQAQTKAKIFLLWKHLLKFKKSYL